MRALEDALARIARRDELRERTGSGRGGAHRVDGPAAADGAVTPSVSPVVDEVTEALQSVVSRNPGVFATVVVQEAETAWSVWIGEWDGTLRTRVTRLDSGPPAVPASASRHPVEVTPATQATPVTAAPTAAEPTPVVPAAATPPAQIPVGPTLVPAPALVPAQRRPVPDHPASYQPAAPVGTVAPTRPMNGPAMNDRVAGRIAELLRREAARETHPA